ncbi:hypothetical protein [Neobacillus novalis]|nr:hypothetical protein [Neobacillus novalis]
MKMIKVRSGEGFSLIRYIILQVEETDTIFHGSYYKPGYKIIIECAGTGLAASGGYEFNPFFGTSVTNRSMKITSNEANVLGFHIQNVIDIEELPDEMDVDKFWNLVYSSAARPRSDVKEWIEQAIEDGTLIEGRTYLKVLFQQDSKVDMDDEINKLLNSDLTIAPHISNSLKTMKSFFSKQEDRDPIYQFGIIDSETKEILMQKSTTGKSIIADYLWCVFDPIPPEHWDIIKEKNGLIYWVQTVLD